MFQLHESTRPWKSEALILFVLADAERPRASAPRFSPELHKAAPWLADSPALRDFTAARSACAVAYAPAATALPRVILAGLGQRATLNSEQELLDALREAAGAAARLCRELRAGDIAFSLPDLCALTPEAPAHALNAAIHGADYGLYRQTACKSDGQEQRNKLPDPARLTLLIRKADAALSACAKQAVISADAVTLARELINGPANLVTPQYMAEQAAGLARRHAPAMRCKTLGPADMRRLGMNALLAVSAGAANEPRFIILEYAPRGHAADAPVVLVGKGLTFDSGGISLKPAAGMEAMKDDMSGAAAVLGVFSALGRLKPARRVIGLLPCTENMPGGTATRPGDIVTTLAGKTVEIVNTDAEGRLALCDALSYAQQHWKPALLVDIATLTGACVVALGRDVAGVFSRDALLPERILDLGRLAGERFWPLPLWDLYFETLKSATADFANAGTRDGGACSAAAFLARFVDPDVRWAHLDIAGPAFASAGNGHAPAGARGFAVQTLLELVLRG